MPQHNFYKPVTVTDPYDPKQRLVGAIVLFIIILIIYGILKLLLGMSDGKFVIPSESETIIIEENSTENQQSDSISYSLPQNFVFLDLNGKPLQEEFYEAEETTKTISQFKINKSKDNEAIEEQEFPNEEIELKEEKNSLITATKSPAELALDICAIKTNEKQWYVQAASFKTEKYAQRIVQKIKQTKLVLEACIIKSRNGWYLVHLPPETDYYRVQYQLEQLYQLLHLKGLIIKLNGT
jgi:cell division septation protein DedD